MRAIMKANGAASTPHSEFELINDTLFASPIRNSSYNSGQKYNPTIVIN